MKTALRLIDRGLVPEPLVRHGIRRLLKDRIDEQRELHTGDPGVRDAWVEAMSGAPIAPVPQSANEQHYEVPADFFRLVLGKRMKYSSAFYRGLDVTLDEAEEAMLALTAERARLTDGQDVLELGCGWGSLTLWMAERFPASRITAVSNSASQREHILGEAARRGLGNVSVRTCDVNELRLEGRFDRIVSVEMFEHLRNWREMLGRMAEWLRPGGKVFLHFFAHRDFAYPFEVRDDSDWMSRHFFTGGMMPSHDLLERVGGPFETEESWIVPGTHYSRTSEDWIANLERNRREVLRVLERDASPEEAKVLCRRWKVFFLACAELFGYAGGDEWIVSHHLLRPRTPRESTS